jgi:myo-inositol-1(or 4)-monophosphatase
MDFQAILDKTVIIAQQAGAIPRAYFSRPFQQFMKGDKDIVTDADRDTEGFLFDALKKAFPDIGIVGEEGSDYLPDAEYRWYIDPIDGTTNFAHRLPHFSVSIGLADWDNVPLLGVIYDPMRDECFAARHGGGATMNGHAIAVSEVDSLEAAVISTGFPYDRRSNSHNLYEVFQKMSLEAQSVRDIGSSALDFCWTAIGRLDGYWEGSLNRWDCYAGIVILEEAGGKVTDYHGGVDGLRAEKIATVASNGRIHGRMLELINSD